MMIVTRLMQHLADVFENDNLDCEDLIGHILIYYLSILFYYKKSIIGTICTACSYSFVSLSPMSLTCLGRKLHACIFFHKDKACRCWQAVAFDYTPK